MKKYRKQVMNLFILIFSYFITVSISMLADFRITKIDILLPILYVGIVFIVGLGLKNYNKDNDKYSLISATICSLCIVTGSKIDMDKRVFIDWKFVDIFYIIILCSFFFLIFMELFYIVENKTNRIRNYIPEKCSMELSQSKLQLFIAGILLLAWLPYYFTFFPGNMGSDTFESVNMILGNISFTNHHPVFFTFLLMCIIEVTSFIGSLTVSLGIFSFLQMITMAFILSRFIAWLLKKGISLGGLLLSVLFFAFHPIIAMYSMYLTKDVLFSGVLLLLVLKLVDIAESKGSLFQNRKERVKLLLLFLLTILLRNNGIFIIVLLSIALLVVFRKYWKSVCIVIISTFLLIGLITGPGFQRMGIKKQSFAESMSIPLQQIGYVIANNGNISGKDLIFLDKIMPIERVKEVYTPGYTDTYKFDEQFNDSFLNENSGEFLQVWAHLCRDNFSDYVKAYLMQTAGYWHYGETNTVSTIGVAKNQLAVSQYDVFQHVFGVSLQPIMEKMILIVRKAPLLCFLSSMAIQAFMVFFCIVLEWKRKKTDRIIAFLPFALLWLTVMIASPAFCLFRYLFPLFLAWPLFIYIILMEKEN